MVEPHKTWFLEFMGKLQHLIVHHDYSWFPQWMAIIWAKKVITYQIYQTSPYLMPYIINNFGCPVLFKELLKRRVSIIHGWRCRGVSPILNHDIPWLTGSIWVKHGIGLLHHASFSIFFQIYPDPNISCFVWIFLWVPGGSSPSKTHAALHL